MIRPTSLNHLGLALTTAGLLTASIARAQTTFTLDPTRSSLTISNASFTENSSAGTQIASGTLTAQTPGSTVSTYSGTLTATLGSGASPSSIVFNSASAVAAQTGSYTPATMTGQGSGPGGSGSYLADYGLTGTVSGTSSAINAAVNNVVFSLASGSVPLGSGGTFAVSSLTLPISGNYGYRSDVIAAIGTRINGGGAFTNGNPATPADASTLTGSYVVANGVATLTIPIDATYTSTSSNLGGQGMAMVTTEVTGMFVATTNVPEPSAWSTLCSGTLLSGWVLARRRHRA